MKKLVLCVCASMCAFSVFAQDDSLYVNLRKIEVVKNQPGIASESLRIVTTLTRNDIANLPVRTINELLDYVPGIDVRSRGTNGVQADITMRGGTFDQVVILLNGINITDPQTGHQNLDLPVDISVIDRIEVLQGTALNVFGLSAFSGAINIITGESPENAINVELVAGENGLFAPHATMVEHQKKLTVVGNVSHNESAGYIDNTDFNYTNAFLQTKYADTTLGNFNFQLGLQAKEFGANAFYSTKYPHQFEKDNTLLSSLQWNKQFGKFLVEEASAVRLHYDEFHLFRNMENAPSWYTGHNHHVTKVFVESLKATYFSSLGKTTIGIEFRNENILSNVLGDKLSTPVDVRFVAADSVKFLYGKNRMNCNYFGEQTFVLGKATASVGVSGNHNSMFGSHVCWGANVGYALTAQNRLYANINKSMRMPTFTDMYYKSATQLANPNLQPEESITFEIGNKAQYTAFAYRISSYYRIGQNIIDWAKKENDDVWMSMNIPNVNAFGVEASTQYNFQRILNHVELSYAFCRLDKKSGEYISKYALDYLRHSLSVSIEHSIYKYLGANWQLTTQNRSGSYFNSANEVTEYAPFSILDGQLFWKAGNAKMYLEIANIFNTTYFDYGGIEQPGRWVKMGIAVHL